MFHSTMTIGQITIDSIEYISITDEININNEKITTLDLEIRFKDSIALWCTNKISRTEYEYKIYHPKKNLTTDQTIVSEKVKNERDDLEIEYLNYLDTVKSESLNVVDSSIIQELLSYLQGEIMSREEFLEIIEFEKMSSEKQTTLSKELIEFRNLTYFPLLGVTVFLKNREEIIFFTETQSEIVVPWIFPSEDKTNYDPRVNWVMMKLLPINLSYNRKRLSSNLTDLKSRINELLN